jgi:tetratricopeptide (TPR) repeat protein
MHLGMTAGRFQRTLTRWELADRGYAYALEAAELQQDRRGVLLARLGRAKVLFGKGNLPESKSQIEAIIAEASGKELADAKAWAYADLAALLEKQELPWESLRANYLAFQHFRDSHDRAKVLSNLGGALRGVGALSAARSAFEGVLRTTTDWYLIANAKVELMGIGSENDDELAFRRYWQAAEEHASGMTPSLAVDFRYRVGLGLNRFGKRLAAQRWLIEARSIAETHGLNEWYFRLDGLVKGISAGSEIPVDAPKVVDERHVSSVGEIETGLRRYAEALAS